MRCNEKNMEEIDMSRVKTILALIGVILVAVFAVQNYQAAVIRFLVYEVSVSLALIIVLTTAIGVIIGLIVGLNSSFKASKNARELNKQQTTLQKSMEQTDLENKKLLGQIDNLNAQLAALQQQLAAASNAPLPSAQDFNDSVDSLEI